MAPADVVDGEGVPGRSGFRVGAGGGCGEVACVDVGPVVRGPAESIGIAEMATVHVTRIALIVFDVARRAASRETAVAISRFVKASGKPAAGV